MANYLNQVMDDVKDFIENEIDLEEYRGNREELEEKLNDDLFCEDSVTGNASGSYFCNSYKSREAVLDDMDTVQEALREFCVDASEIGNRFLNEDWEWLDVTARCYILNQAIREVLDDLESDGVFDEIEDEEEEIEEAKQA